MSTKKAAHSAKVKSCAQDKETKKYESIKQHNDIIITAMQKIDPFLRFLTKATGKTCVPIKLLHQVLPKSSSSTNTNDTSGKDIMNSAPSTEKPNAESNNMNEMILTELNHRGVLNYNHEKQTVGFPLPPSPSNSADNTDTTSNNTTAKKSLIIPKPPSKMVGKGLHGSSEPAAKRRMKVLKWTLDKVPDWVWKQDNVNDAAVQSAKKPKAKSGTKKRKGKDDINATTEKDIDEHDEKQNNTVKDVDERLDECQDRRSAYQALDSLLSGKSVEKKHTTTTTTDDDNDDTKKKSTKQWLPCQAAYAGSDPSREVRYGTLSKETIAKIPSEILQLFDLLDSNDNETSISDKPKRQLYLHQAKAIESAMNNTHTVVQTATGSGKSMCFLLPVLAKAMRSIQPQDGDTPSCSGGGEAAILLFPTKALAQESPQDTISSLSSSLFVITCIFQDQYSKIKSLLQSLPINAGVIDGDTPHQQRDDIAETCQIILTNPDTLHAAILPNWKKKHSYQRLLSRVTTIVVDEGHVYDGAFGAHVSLVLARLKRICRVASSPSNTGNTKAASITFIVCSATMLHPETCFRQLCPVGEEEKVCVLTSCDDGSPCNAKHFFVWNPPILDVNGNSTESVFVPKSTNKAKDGNAIECEVDNDAPTVNIPVGSRKRKRKATSTMGQNSHSQHSNIFIRRRHAADETAYILAKAITSGIRTIAFCKTRGLVEWVYEKTLSILQSNPDTADLTSKVESYRGGYTAEVRRSIEERLFQRKLFAVVGTNALELGVDVGGVDLTLHTGYPGSISSLLQQAGRAGRGKDVSASAQSCAIMIAFSSPAEQYIWKNPKVLLTKGSDKAPALPLNGTVIKGHLLCAGQEFPLQTGDQSVSCLLNECGKSNNDCPSDCTLLAPVQDEYEENVAYLLKKGLLSRKDVTVASEAANTSKSNEVKRVSVYSTHPVVKNPWKRVSLRSIEPVSYAIVDLSHNLQGGKTDKIHHPSVVLDTIPYSRVFYHSFPGAVIMHRGRKYRISSMENPPPFVGGSSYDTCGCNDLLAFAKPTTVQYSTQALSCNQITVVKLIKHAESNCNDEKKQEEKEEKKKLVTSTVAGYGIVTVKRTVHGYKKLSHVNRTELSRTTISLPPMEFDTHALWIDADATYLRELVLDYDSGVHALSHAMVAVAPLFVACSIADIDCDHSRYDTTRIMIYDQRAGGSGITAQLYPFILDAMKAAVDLLEECTSCHTSKFDGGCPACLQSVPCDNFHQDLSRSAGVKVGKHLIKRLEDSNLKTQNNGLDVSNPNVQSPHKPKSIMIGRASWTNNKTDRTRFAMNDEI